MSYNHTTTVDYVTNVGIVSTRAETVSAATQATLNLTVAAGATNVHSVFAVTVASVKSFVLYSSKAVTVKTNSASSPAQTFNLSAGVPLTWNLNRTYANPLNVNVTDLYFTNSGLEATDITIRSLS